MYEDISTWLKRWQPRIPQSACGLRWIRTPSKADRFVVMTTDPIDVHDRRSTGIATDRCVQSRAATGRRDELDQRAQKDQRRRETAPTIIEHHS